MKRSKSVRYKEAMVLMDDFEKDINKFMVGLGEVETYPQELTLHSFYITMDAWFRVFKERKSGVKRRIEQIEEDEKGC